MVLPASKDHEAKGAGAPAEVEMTPAMVAAGVDAYWACDREFDASEKIVSEVFQAMIAVHLSPMPEASSDHRSKHISPWWQT